jgi:hypothetical protein
VISIVGAPDKQGTIKREGIAGTAAVALRTISANFDKASASTARPGAKYPSSLLRRIRIG